MVRYAYLWRKEALRGHEEGRKDRPCAVVASVSVADGVVEVVVLPITHAPPASRDQAIPLPAAVKVRLGLNDDPSWIITTEANQFVWPGPDLRPVRPGGGFSYGYLPEIVTKRMLDQVRADLRRGVLATVRRLE